MMRGDDGSRRRRLHRAESSEATAAKGYRAPQTHRGTPRKRHHRLRFGRVWVFGDVLEGLSLDVDAKFTAHADAGFGEGVRRRRDDGARAPREATHRRGFDVQREAHAALEEKLPREPRDGAFHERDVRAQRAHSRHRRAQMFVFLIQQRVHRTQPRAVLRALVLERPPRAAPRARGRRADACVCARDFCGTSRRAA